MDTQRRLMDLKNGFIPVCLYCHTMIHRVENGERLTIEELKESFK